MSRKRKDVLTDIEKVVAKIRKLDDKLEEAKLLRIDIDKDRVATLYRLAKLFDELLSSGGIK